MAAEAAGPGEEERGEAGGEQEGDAEAERIDEEQEGAARRPYPRVPATARIAPRIGPMQGVQPKAKARPRT